MRILILQDHLRVGGTERQSLFLLKAFRSEGHDARLLVFRAGGHLYSEAATLGPTIVLQPFQSGLSFWAPGLIREIARQNPDIILCMGRSANSYAGYIQRNFPERAVIGTIRTGKALFPFHQWSMQVVRGVLVNSNWWKRRFLETGYPPERVHVVHNALLLDRTEGERLDARAQLREQEQIGSETCVFLNVATFRPGKRHLELLRIARRLEEKGPADWRLWLVGDGQELNRCKRWALRNGLAARTRFFHYQKDPFPFYAAADVAVSVSREDSLPNFLVEAQSMGLPVLAYDCRGVVETCLPGKTGIILPAGETVRFQEAMESLLASAELRAELGNAAPAFAQKHFSRGPQAHAMLEFFAHLLAHSPKPRLRPCQGGESDPYHGA